jgi:hypothetical protein
MPTPDEARPARLEVRLIDPVWDGLYAPLGRVMNWLTGRFNRLQAMTVRRYLLLMFVTLVVMLILVAARRA